MGTTGTDEKFLLAAAVRERYGNVSDMWLWRRLNEAGSTFPKPIVIKRRRFWRLSELIVWESEQAERAG